MRRNSLNRFTTLALATSVLLALQGTATATTHPDDITALNALYDATDGNNWTNKTGWKSGDPCDDGWYGIECSLPGENRRVIKLLLTNNNLTGNIPGQIGKLTGLLELYIDRNKLSGPIPTEIGDLSSLKLLGIGGNNLSGSVPDSIGNLSNVETIYLVNNKLSGSLPSALTNLTTLKHLYIDFNSFTGELPDLSATLDTNNSGGCNKCSDFSYNALSANWSLDIEGYTGKPFASTQTVAPKNVTVNATGEKTIDVSWDQVSNLPQNLEGTPFRKVEYLVTATPTGSSGEVVKTTVGRSNATAQLTELVPGTEYSITVKTVTELNRPQPFESETYTIESLPSAAVKATTQGTKPSGIGPADAQHSSFSANKTSVDVGEKVTLTVIVRDKDNNNLNKGGDTVTFSATPSGLANLTTATDHGDGSYTAQLTGVKAGEVTVEAKLNGEVLGQQKITIKASSTDDGTSGNKGGGSGSTGVGLLMALGGLWRVRRIGRQRH